MNALLIILCVITLTVQSVFKKKFSIKINHAEFTFSTLVSFFALLFFVITSVGAVYNTEIIPFSFLFSVCYAASTVTGTLALGCGSLAITSLILSYSLVIPTLSGIVLWNEEIGSLQSIGIVILLISLFLIRNKADTGKKKVSFKWLIFVATGSVTNGFCSVVQRQQQIVFGGIYDMSFMVIALAFVVLMLGVCAAIREWKQIKPALKHGTGLAFLCGACNGATNLFVMICVAMIPATLFYPVLSAGQLILVFVISVVGFKEKFLKRQIWGLALGIMALVLMNL